MCSVMPSAFGGTWLLLYIGKVGLLKLLEKLLKPLKLGMYSYPFKHQMTLIVIASLTKLAS